MDLDVLRLSERVDLARQIGESHFREFKSAYEGPPGQKKLRDAKDVARDIAETLVAFANADGGELFVGIEDDGAVTGTHHSNDKLQLLLSVPKTRIHKDTPLPSPRAIKIEYGGAVVLYFAVPKGTDVVHLTSDGKCLQRKDLESVPIASEHIRFSRYEIASREYDRKFVPNADIADLDLELLSHVAEQLSKGMSVEKCLQHLDLADFDGHRLQLRKAALLLFASDAVKWHPRLQVRIIKVKGTELKTGADYNVTSDETVSANILQLIEDSWEQLRPHLTETRFSSKAIFRTQIIYPELACREAVINAIAHRDYNLEGQGIEIHVYDDRLTVISPGGLLSSISIDDLREQRGVHQSRNSFVARVLRELGYMRELGEGVRRIFDLMKSNDLAPPELRADNNEFQVALHHRLSYTKEEQLWLDNFNSLLLDRDQKTVVRLGVNGREISPDEIFDAVGILDTDDYRKLVESLYELGILKRTVQREDRQRVAKNRGVAIKKLPQFVIEPVPAQPKPKKEAADDIDYTKVFVTNFPFGSKDDEIAGALEQFGEVVNVHVPVNHETGQQRGFAFVEFSNKADAAMAVAGSGAPALKGRTIYIQEYRPKDTHDRRRALTKPLKFKR